MSKIEIDDKKLLGLNGLELYKAFSGGRVVILPLHENKCDQKPCVCGADESMPNETEARKIKLPGFIERHHLLKCE